VDKLFHVPNTDCGFWFMHPAIVERLRSIDYRLSNLGWGIDIINIKEAQKQGRLVLRDYSVETDQLDHKCGYNVKEASVGRKILEEIYSKMDDSVAKTEAAPL
jgi:hypothetical protein